MPPRLAPLAVALAAALSLASSAGAQVQPVRSFALNGYNRVLDGQWQGMRYASDGNVYFGSSTHSGHHGAAFFKYNPTTQQVTQLAADLTLICGEDPDISPQGKLHSDIVEANGWLYFSTKFSSEKPGAQGKWTGSHVIGYQLATGVFRDYGVIHPKYDSYSGIGVDKARNKIYVFVKSLLSNEPSYLYGIDATTGAKQILGMLGDSLHTSMWIFVDQRGDGWFSLARDHGNLLRVRASTGQVDVFQNALPPLYRWNVEQVDPSALHQDQRWIHWMQPLDGNRALVILGYEGGMLYMFDSSKPIAQAFTNIKHIGYTYYGVAIGNNGSRVYYYQRASKATLGHQEFRDFHLKSVSLNPADGYAITDHGLIRDQDGRLVWRVPSMMTDGGSRVFMSGDWWTNPGDLGTLRYFHNGTAEGYTPLPRGEFFAVADVSTGPSMFVSPATVTLQANGTQQFSATVTGVSNPSVTWTIDPAVGYVTMGGLYTAPSTISATQTVDVIATSVEDPARSARAVVTLQPPPVTVNVSPAQATLGPGGEQQFTATVQNASNTAVTWSISPARGSITAAGKYTAPTSVAAAETVTVTAKSVQDSSKLDTATVHLTPPPPVPGTIRIDSGVMNSDYTDANGALWSRDAHFTGGQTVSGSGITGTNDPNLYRIAREGIYGGGFTYTIPVPNGAYGVTLKFAEFKMTLPGQRIFNVSINGQPVLANFDILGESALRTALDKSFAVNVCDGAIVIALARVKGVPILSAIEIIPTGPAPTDNTAPVRSAGAPSGVLAGGTTQTTLSLSTNEDAACRYSTSAGIAYGSMTGVFSTTGGRAHQTSVSGLVNGQAYVFRVRCKDASENANGDDYTIGFSVGSGGGPAGTSIIRLNAGRTTGVYVDTTGQTWAPDQYFQGGGQVSAPTVTGTPEVQLYRVARSSLYSDFGWDIPVENGRYRVTLKFAETTYTAAGQRVFDVAINGVTVLNDFDIVAETGAWRTALDKSFTVDVTNGRVAIAITKVNRFGIVSAIEIVPLP